MGNEAAIELYKFLRRVVREHKKRLSILYPPSSLPGEYPRMRTGNLRRSVGFTPGTAREIARNGGSARMAYWRRAYYGNILEIKMNRLSLADTIRDLLSARGNQRVTIRHRHVDSYETLPG